MKQSFPSLWARLVAPKPQDQRGIALLLTLGILSLLLVLAMSFAYSTRTERMAAGNNADLVKARLLAESGLERAMVGLRAACSPGSYATTEQRLYPGTNGNFFSSATSSAAWTGRRYLFSIGGDTADIAGGLASSFSSSAGTYSFTPSSDSLGAGWIDVLDTSTTSTSQPIIGRVSYVVVDQGGMIDPGAVVSATTPARVGADPTEIQLSNLSSPANAAAAGFLGNMPAGKRWFSMRHIAIGNTDAQDKFNIFRQALFPWSRDTDNYRLTPTSTDERTRYSLANTGTGSTVAALASTGTDGIPWLSNLQAEGGSSVASQVAANLKDYCDADEVATNDYGGTIGSSASHVGLEAVPYVNEVVINAALTTTGTPAQSILTLTANCELINLYSTARTAHVQLLVEYTAGGGWTGASSNLQQALNNISVPANGYVDIGSVSVSNTLSPAVSSAVTLTITKVSVVVSNSSGVFNSSTLWDYCMLGTNSPVLSINPGTTQSISVQVKDPRSNTGYADNWEWGEWDGGDSMGSVNDNSDPRNKDTATPPGDLETVSAPTSGISTAYIRNGDMQSLWELGAIHRGEAWRTLNLSKYNTTATGTAGTGGKYGDGDANILDQVRLTATATAPIRGRFNANSPQTEAWACFLAGVTVDGTYASPSSGTALTNANGNDLASGTNGIFKVNGADRSVSGNVPFTNRGGIAKWVDPSDATTRTALSKGTVATQATDRAREEIIGKIAGLLTVRSNYFSVIVTAQAVKDTGTVNAGGNSVEYDTVNNKYCQVLAEQKILAVVSRDAFTDDFVVESFEYLNE